MKFQGLSLTLWPVQGQKGWEHMRAIAERQAQIPSKGGSQKY